MILHIEVDKVVMNVIFQRIHIDWHFLVLILVDDHFLCWSNFFGQIFGELRMLFSVVHQQSDGVALRGMGFSQTTVVVSDLVHFEEKLHSLVFDHGRGSLKFQKLSKQFSSFFLFLKIGIILIFKKKFFQKFFHFPQICITQMKTVAATSFTVAFASRSRSSCLLPLRSASSHPFAPFRPLVASPSTSW